MLAISRVVTSAAVHNLNFCYLPQLKAASSYNNLNNGI